MSLSDWLSIGLRNCDGGTEQNTKQEIRPHRFGGEGVLIGGQNGNTKCSMTFVNIAVAISALAGGPKNGFAPRPEYGGVFDIFRGFLGVWAQEGIEMEFWVILVAFRQWKNGQKWKKHCT